MKRLLRRFSSLRRDQRGISAVEFAMLLPLMLTLYFGVVEVTQGIATQRKVTLTARTIADIVSQFTSIKNADMSNMLNASAAVIAPYDVGQLQVKVSAVSIDGNGIAKVVWSDALNATARGVDSTVTVPPALNVANTQLIWSEVTYTYVPLVGNVITGTIYLNDQMYMRPRLSETVNRVNS
jgi:Flp pilus assembly protein TadG